MDTAESIKESVRADKQEKLSSSVKLREGDWDEQALICASLAMGAKMHQLATLFLFYFKSTSLYSILVSTCGVDTVLVSYKWAPRPMLPGPG